MLHPAPDIEDIHPQVLISISDGVRGLVAAGDQANGPCTVLFPHATAGPALMSRLNLRGALDWLVQARTDFQYQFGAPAVQVKRALVDHSMPVPEGDGQLDPGWSQEVLVCGFDGPRPRPVQVCPLVNT